jgi:hypothetical protein
MNKLTKLKLVVVFIKGFTASVGAALIIDGKHPYITLLVLGVGAGAIEMINLMQQSDEKID